MIPAGTQLAPRNPGVKPWTDLSANQRRSPAACRRRSRPSSTTPTPRSAGWSRFLDRRRFDNTLILMLSDNGASQEGGRSGVLDEMKWFNGIRESADEAVTRLDDIGGPDSHSNYPLGLGPGRQHAAEAVQAEHPRRRRARPLIMHWPAGIRRGARPATSSAT